MGGCCANEKEPTDDDVNESYFLICANFAGKMKVWRSESIAQKPDMDVSSLSKPLRHAKWMNPIRSQRRRNVPAIDIVCPVNANTQTTRMAASLNSLMALKVDD